MFVLESNLLYSKLLLENIRKVIQITLRESCIENMEHWRVGEWVSKFEKLYPADSILGRKFKIQSLKSQFITLFYVYLLKIMPEWMDFKMLIYLCATYRDSVR